VSESIQTLFFKCSFQTSRVSAKSQVKVATNKADRAAPATALTRTLLLVTEETPTLPPPMVVATVVTVAKLLQALLTHMRRESDTPDLNMY
jgi:hypothetical protein